MVGELKAKLSTIAITGIQFNAGKIKLLFKKQGQEKNLLRPCSFQIFSSFPPAILIRSLGCDLSFYSGRDSHSSSCLSKLLCVQFYYVDAHPLGFSHEGLLSIPQIKHMTYATLLLSYCSYCLSLYLLSFTYFFPH
jgi:hypothetical protein